jgi:hypothetical protein
LPTTNAVRNLTRAAVGLAFAAVLIIVAVGFLYLSMQTNINDLRTGNTPASAQARRSRARMQFAVCAKSPAAVDSVKQSDFRSACKGYDTLEHAYRSEGVSPP